MREKGSQAAKLRHRLAFANFIVVSQAFFISETDAPAKRTIMVEALRLFSRKGIRETTIRDIAAAVGYSNPALYKHFSSKDELALELFVACYRECTYAICSRTCSRQPSGWAVRQMFCLIFGSIFMPWTLNQPPDVTTWGLRLTKAQSNSCFSFSPQPAAVIAAPRSLPAARKSALLRFKWLWAATMSRP